MAWWSLDPRAIFEFECVRITRRLARTIRSGKFRVTCNRDFAGVIHGCGTVGDRSVGDLAHAVDGRRLHGAASARACP